jgi:hypothetical protein
MIGIIGTLDYNLNTPQQSKYPFPFGESNNIPFSPGNSIGWSTGLKFEYNLFSDIFLGTRIAYNYLPLNFIANEEMNVVKEGDIKRVNVISKINSYFKRFNAEFEIGSDFSGFDLSLGLSFGIPIENKYYISQNLSDEENFELLTPFTDTSVISTQYSNFTYHPFIRLSFTPFYKKFRSQSGINTAFDATFRFPVNSMSDEMDWRYSSVSLGVNISFSFSDLNKPDMIQYDTVYVRDTSVVFDSRVKRDTVYLLSSIENQNLADAEFALIITEYKQKWIRMIPKPVAMLIGELESHFIDKTGRVTSESNLSYVTNITEWQFLDNKQPKKHQLNVVADTSLDIIYPIIRLYPRIISEAGIQSSTIHFVENNDTLKKIAFNNLNDFIDIDLNTFLHRKDINSNNRLIKLVLEMVDNDGQKFHSVTNSITFSEKRSNNSILRNKYIVFYSDSDKMTYLKDILHSKSVSKIYLLKDSISNNPSLEEILIKYQIDNLNEIKKIIPEKIFRNDMILFKVID